jgi:hypothetical protein
MKRVIGFAAFLMLSACSSNATLKLQLNSNDTATAALRAGSASTAESVDLTTVAHVNVTIDEVSVHVDDDGSAPEVDDHSGDVDSSKVEDGDKNWQVVSTTPQSFDLMTVRADATKPLGTITLPPGKITEVRLKLATNGDAGNGDDVITGAVVDTDGTVCDLIVPHSVTDPGLKIEGLFKAKDLEGGSTQIATVNLKLKDSQKLSTATCAFRLNPEIEIEKFETESGDDHGTEADGGSDDAHVDGGV